MFSATIFQSSVQNVLSAQWGEIRQKLQNRHNVNGWTDQWNVTTHLLINDGSIREESLSWAGDQTAVMSLKNGSEPLQSVSEFCWSSCESTAQDKQNRTRAGRRVNIGPSQMKTVWMWRLQSFHCCSEVQRFWGDVFMSEPLDRQNTLLYQPPCFSLDSYGGSEPLTALFCLYQWKINKSVMCEFVLWILKW